MFVTTRLAEGLLVGHLFLVLAYLTGAAVTPAAYMRSDNLGSASALLRVVAVCGTGVAILGFSLLALASAGLMRLPELLLLVPSLTIIAALVRRTSPLSASFWSGHCAAIWEACDTPCVTVYFVMLVLAAPAVLPNVGGDTIHYHLAYAQDWANSGRLDIDPFLRFPFYASNFLLITSAALALNAATVINFITWATALITALGLFACARTILDRAAGRPWNAWTAAILATGVVASPVYWRWMMTAYQDVPIAMLLFVAMACLCTALVTQQSFWLYASAVVAAFFVGCKPSFILLLPFFILAIAFVGSRIGTSRRALWGAALCLVLLSAPWYVRNFVLTGDPIPPVLNLTLHGYDGFVNKSEWAGIQEDLGTTKTALSFVTLPFRAFANSDATDFREYGSPALILLLFVPAAYLLIAFARGRRIEPATTLFAGALCVLTLYWFGISSLLRYAIPLLPILAVSLACCASAFLRRYPRAAFVLTIAAALTAVPSAYSHQWYIERYRNNYKYASQVFTGDDAFLRVNDDGYAEEQFSVRELKKHDLPGPVYIIGGATEYWFRRDRFQTAGDWIGPAGWYRLYRATDLNRADAFLGDLGIDAVLLDRSFVLGGLDVPLARQLESGGFEHITIPSSHFELFLKDRTSEVGASKA